MSDNRETVKLIIEIPKSAYKVCRELRTNNDDGIIGLSAVNAIANGKPYEIKGEWIDKGSLSCRCSKCGCKSTAETNFCAVCGAEMRGGSE